jgi:hypothetical protein
LIHWLLVDWLRLRLGSRLLDLLHRLFHGRGLRCRLGLLLGLLDRLLLLHGPLHGPTLSRAVDYLTRHNHGSVRPGDPFQVRPCASGGMAYHAPAVRVVHGIRQIGFITVN